MKDEGCAPVLFLFDLFASLGKQMAVSPYREFHFLFDIQINSLPRFIYFCHWWKCSFKEPHIVMLFSYIMTFTVG